MRLLRVVVVIAALVIPVIPEPAGAIVGGSAVPNGAYPFMASVQDGGFHFCGGSVIGSTWVLTAAHCVPDGNAAGLSVVVGTNNNANGSGTRITVNQVRVHPDYDDQAMTNDSALLQLSAPVPAAITPIRLAETSDDPLEADGQPVTVAGWGDWNPATMGLLAGPTLQQADLQVVGDSQCFGDTTSESALTGVCAEAFGKDSCQGDSGGPLFAQTGTGRVQLGIVSYGFLCAIPTQPGVYSEVNSATIRSWVRSVTGI